MAKKALKLCKMKDCRNVGTTLGYCRLHYLKNWKKIREQQKKKAAENLNKYVEHIMKKHPDSYVETIKHDLKHASRFQERADEYCANDDYSDVMGEVDLGVEVEKILDHIKVDETF
ncbi:MAG: hypothetical protein A3G32_04030 [Deltaproteobacteria bacterium RIFCSPLOWO2_12_FULL_40_28]|nr:MAG: hypothetical protein A3C45_06115 [Deltaproteobacteria bacterium RIFCSPHIGHO2_02_FULL_40_28]OGQ20490.1 MAG: hypothetical protein A3E27_01910 [Deltaproteobacteria bacterium RIFCSPHIGHO2_12_FULL_40_32]OGQ41120.1 MAG: hypothetical protein A3I69_08775 [Deltaproteobacteria bacterium RIFCSPLOWO2_02_FULL_40_36]OGQ55100.1 MAG: hypothetical protein A3G32_04030 [Deltaproteobacteria bacterium RIFCSPLOWO2_12_FULL_40_28]